MSTSMEGIAFLLCATGIPIVLSSVCLPYLPSIIRSDGPWEESIVFQQAFVIISFAMGVLTALAGPSNLTGLGMNLSFILWGFCVENSLALVTRMGFVNGGASMAVGFIRHMAKDKDDRWWALIVVPIMFAFLLNLISWRFKKSLFPEDPDKVAGSKVLEEAKKFVVSLSREQHSLREINQITEILQQKLIVHEKLRSATLTSYNATRQAMSGAEHLWQTLQPVPSLEIPNSADTVQPPSLVQSSGILPEGNETVALTINSENTIQGVQSSGIVPEGNGAVTLTMNSSTNSTVISGSGYVEGNGSVPLTMDSSAETPSSAFK